MFFPNISGVWHTRRAVTCGNATDDRGTRRQPRTIRRRNLRIVRPLSSPSQHRLRRRAAHRRNARYRPGEERAESSLSGGDEIVAVEDKPVEYYMAQTREFISCSNENDVLAATADQILRTKENRPLSIRYRRDGVTRDTLADVTKMPGDISVGITFGNTTRHSRCSKIRSGISVRTNSRKRRRYRRSQTA